METLPPLPDDLLDLGRRLIPRPLFLVGCARSGTSIFGEALASHPAVAYLFEVSRIWDAEFPGRPDHRLEPRDAEPAAARRLYEALSGAAAGQEGPVLLEKNPKHVLRVAFLDRLFPWARFLHIVRDGRDVVASLMFRNRGARWGHLEVPGWRELLERYPRENHLRCAWQWRRAVETARREGGALAPERWLEVRYEDLLAESRATLSRSLDFAGLALEPEVEAFLPRIQDETAGSYHARKQVRHFVDDHARRVGRHRENLTPAELAGVEAVCGDLLAELGYR